MSSVELGAGLVTVSKADLLPTFVAGEFLECWMEGYYSWLHIRVILGSFKTHGYRCILGGITGSVLIHLNQASIAVK